MAVVWSVTNLEYTNDFATPQSINKIQQLVKFDHNNATKPFIEGITKRSTDIIDTRQKLQQLIIKCIIHSLRIQYKSGKILYYPSLTAHYLKAITSFKWKVEESLFRRFKAWPK